MTWTTAARSFRDPKTGTKLSVRIVQPVCDDANYMADVLKWPLLGIIGNTQHWQDVPAGDHTARSTHVGRKGAPLRGWVYAIDIGVPEARKTWVRDQILKLARSGELPQLKYFNIAGRHYNQNNNFSSYVRSDDQHLHLSYERTFEESTGRGILRAMHEGGQDLTKNDIANIFTWDPGDDETGVNNWPWRDDAKTNTTVQARFAWWLAVDKAHAAYVAASEANTRVAGLEARLDSLPKVLAPALVAAVRAGLADGISNDALVVAVEAGVRRVLASLVTQPK
ncbi:hypothetical protein Afil01_62250 [Actinorhabdospora filicis]|uniref:Uncharacterized protein n=1 Tax=Actinorhabdospora filicis TaxID=1785913 RepID=A0A9W6SST4_9ACTN|nr:hypothetical protein [Actinorhabdospora filicis]GLZ81418.1 hypothetical protein Afil01_62250 [Actinorhabdospora filicis]